MLTRELAKEREKTAKIKEMLESSKSKCRFVQRLSRPKVRVASTKIVVSTAEVHQDELARARVGFVPIAEMNSKIKEMEACHRAGMDILEKDRDGQLTKMAKELETAKGHAATRKTQFEELQKNSEEREATLKGEIHELNRKYDQLELAVNATSHEILGELLKSS